MGLLAMGLLLTVLGLSAATARTGTADPLGLSADETGPWTSSLTEPLFGAGMRWVPGDVETGEFWARNQSHDSGELRVVVVPQLDGLHDDLDLQIRAGSDAWAPLTTTWTTPRALPAGSTTRIQLRAELKGTATNAAQTLAFSFDVRARLDYAVGTDPTPTVGPTDAVTTPPGSQPRPDTQVTDARAVAPHGSLADTGAGTSAWLLPVGLGATITGLWLALGARRREKRDIHE